MRGVCHRYPRLNFVSVESGFGYIPFLLQALDWQFINNGIHSEQPEWPLPSEAFHRQIYATFWFERILAAQIDEFQDNVMFETDFPHPTSLSPGPNSSSALPSEVVESTLEGISQDVKRKLLHGNAARIYHLP
jgi:predicted TIM-barrel fold metal-dependent hydrolase